MGHSRPLCLYFRLFNTVDRKQCSIQILPMTEFKPRTSGVGNSGATTIVQVRFQFNSSGSIRRRAKQRSTFAYEVYEYPSIPRCLYRPDVIQRTFILNSQPRDCDAFTMPKNHFAQHVLHKMYYLIIKPIIVLVLVSYHFWLNLVHQWPMVKILFLELGIFF